jgi:predicted aminopeptidase
MRALGWFILVGSVAAVALQGFAVDALLNSMLRDQNDFADSIPLHGSLFVPVLSTAVLLTFARFIRAGVAMDEEIKGTV